MRLPPLSPATRHTVTFAGLMTGLAVALTLHGYGQAAFAAAILAAAATFSVLRHLASREDQR
jgi:hypothetical protein